MLKHLQKGPCAAVMIAADRVLATAKTTHKVEFDGESKRSGRVEEILSKQLRVLAKVQCARDRVIPRQKDMEADESGIDAAKNASSTKQTRLPERRGPPHTKIHAGRGDRMLVK